MLEIDLRFSNFWQQAFELLDYGIQVDWGLLWLLFLHPLIFLLLLLFVYDLHRQHLIGNWLNLVLKGFPFLILPLQI